MKLTESKVSNMYVTIGYNPSARAQLRLRAESVLPESHHLILPDLMAACSLHCTEDITQCFKSVFGDDGRSQHHCLRCRHHHGGPPKRSVPRSDHRRGKRGARKHQSCQ